MRKCIYFSIFLFACKSMSINSSSVRDAEQVTPSAIPTSDILESFSYIFYRGNPLPPAPTNEEIAAAQTILPTLGAQEKALLDKIFGEKHELIALAMRDTDRDGIKDFRVSHYFGKFHEGDLDLDNDGIRNIYDVEPYDPSIGGKDETGDGIPNIEFSDTNRNNIPDHIDWDLTLPERPGREFHVATQQKLFAKNKIILVERNADFNESTVRAVDDAISHVFRSRFESTPVLPTLRTIASESQVLIQAEEGGDTNAMVASFSNSLIIYESGLNAAPLVRLGLLIHEIGHSFQYAEDYAGDTKVEANRTYYPQRKFFASLAPWDWEVDRSTISLWQTFKSFTPIYEIIRPNFHYQGKSSKQWADFSNDVWNEFGDDYLRSEPIQSRHIVSDYSLTDPFEWESDNLIAYVFSAMESTYAANSPYSRDQISNRIAETTSLDWPGFLHANFNGSPFAQHFKEKYPLDETSLSQLATQYLTPLMQGGMQLTSTMVRPSKRCFGHIHP